MKYYPDTDTLHIELRPVEVVETRELDRDTLLDLDGRGRVCGMTIEHAKERANMPSFSYEEAVVTE
jgi:uncharacterized protein YuzE